MQCRHEILRHELLYAPSLFLSDANYEVSYIGLKAQNIYQELETCLKIIWFADNNIPVAAFFKAQTRGWKFRGNYGNITNSQRKI